MSIIAQDIVSLYKDFWKGTNKDALFHITYNKHNKNTSATEAGLVKPWMEGSATWVFARSVYSAYKTGDMSKISDALDIIEHELSQEAYAGAGYPCFSLNTGAGCVAGMITEYARYHNQTIWFELPEPWDYDRIIALQQDHMTGLAEVMFTAVSMTVDRLKDKAVISPLDLGGLADVLSSLRRTENILYDMYDYPEMIKESLWSLRAIWVNYHEKMTKILADANKNMHSSWVKLLSDSVYYPSQCDVSAMISPDMFEELVIPTLSDEFSSYKQTLYHLDGSGQIPHLRLLCSNPSLRAIQWVPEPGVSHFDPRYFPLYKSIISYGRKIVFNCHTSTPDAIKGFFRVLPSESFFITVWANTYDEAMRYTDIKSLC